LKSDAIATNAGLYFEFQRHQKRVRAIVAFFMAPNISTLPPVRQGGKREKIVRLPFPTLDVRSGI
jgi:hypothetical protein